MSFLTNEQLVLRIKAGENTAANMLQLWEQNKGFIYKIALKYQEYEEIDDLMQQGYLGLYDAIDNYDPSQDVKFITYAGYWIKQSMTRYIDNYSSAVRISVPEQEHIRNYKKVVAEFQMEHSRKPSHDEISSLLGISNKKVKGIEKSLNMKKIQSLDMCVYDEGDTPLSDMIVGDQNVERQVLDPMNQKELKKVLWEMVDSLGADYSRVLTGYYKDGKTLNEVSQDLGITIERTRQKREQALEKMRVSNRKRILSEYIDGYIRDMSLKGTGLKRFRNTWTSSTERTALKLLEKEKRMRYAQN